MYVTRTFTPDELLDDNFRGADVVITDANGNVTISASEHAYLNRVWREGSENGQVVLLLVSNLTANQSVYRLDSDEHIELGWFEHA